MEKKMDKNAEKLDVKSQAAFNAQKTKAKAYIEKLEKEGIKYRGSATQRFLFSIDDVITKALAAGCSTQDIHEMILECFDKKISNQTINKYIDANGKRKKRNRASK